MRSPKIKVTKDFVYDYKRFDPIPEDKEITSFYEKKYYELIKKGNRAAELRKIMAGGEEAALEKKWLRETLYTDIAHVLEQYALGKRVLDVGCGTGELVLFLNEFGFKAEGIEPNQKALEIARSQGATVYNCFLNELSAHYDPDRKCYFDAITFLNVFEHVPDPAGLIHAAKKFLNKDGILCIRVPNDFSEIQLAAKEHLGLKPWWIAYPDHINYFNYNSLLSFLERLGFEVIYTQTDFPMEIFLLMGEIYVGNPEIGNKCHQNRVLFETALPGDLRRKIYRAFAEVGIGRDILTFARVKKDERINY